MTATCPPAPAAAGALKLDLKELPIGTRFVRFHSLAYAATAFNPHVGKDMKVAADGARFSPFPDALGTNVPTIYAGTTDQAAALESVFHEVPHEADPDFPSSKLKSYGLSRFESTRKIDVLLLINSQLRQVSVPGRSLSLQEDEIIHSLPDQYPTTRAWAQHFHRSIKDIDGLAWRPRLGGEGESYVLFGPRFNATDFTMVDDRIHIFAGPGRVLIDSIAAEAHIHIVTT
jgi:hypothetical protein